MKDPQGKDNGESFRHTTDETVLSVQEKLVLQINPNARLIYSRDPAVSDRTSPIAIQRIGDQTGAEHNEPGARNDHVPNRHDASRK